MYRIHIDLVVMESFSTLAIESIFVGAYSAFLYFPLYALFSRHLRVPWIFFMAGVLKHFVGYLSGIHTYYCNKGEACKRAHPDQEQYVSKNGWIFYESLGEGLLYGMISYFFYDRISANLDIQLVFIFCIGFFLHIIMEHIGAHTFFCKERCIHIV